MRRSCSIPCKRRFHCTWDKKNRANPLVLKSNAVSTPSSLDWARLALLEKTPLPPGENGNKRKKYSDFALRLEEKQKLRFHYGLKEKQLRRFIRDSKKGQGTNWVAKLVGRLECRLDNLVFRFGMAPSIRSARQLVSHGHVTVNGKKVDISSYVVKQGDEVSISEKAKENQIVLAATQNPRLEIPDFLAQGRQERTPRWSRASRPRPRAHSVLF